MARPVRRTLEIGRVPEVRVQAGTGDLAGGRLGLVRVRRRVRVLSWRKTTLRRSLTIYLLASPFLERGRRGEKGVLEGGVGSLGGDQEVLDGSGEGVLEGE